MVKYRVIWTLDDGRIMASEYDSRNKADFHRNDIAGWIPNARIEPIDDDTPPRQGPFEVPPPKTRYDHIIENEE